MPAAKKERKPRPATKSQSTQPDRHSPAPLSKEDAEQARRSANTAAG